MQDLGDSQHCQGNHHVQYILPDPDLAYDMEAPQALQDELEI
jgi:hypothetical protein